MDDQRSIRWPVPDPVVTPHNGWRHGHYPRAPEVDSAGREAGELSEQLRGSRKSSFKDQVKLKATTGFPGINWQVGHAVAFALRKHYRNPTTIALGAHYAAVPGPYNFQGNTRLARWIGVSDRTVRRHRLRLEQDGWIKSYLLLPGDKVLGQKWPVLRPRIVRDTSKLHRLGNARTPTLRYSQPAPRGSKPRRPSAAEVPRETGGDRWGQVGTPATADDLEAVARRSAERGDPFAKQLSAIAAAKRVHEQKTPRPPIKPPPGAAEPMTWEEIDAIEAELILETEMNERREEALREYYATDDG